MIDTAKALLRSRKFAAAVLGSIGVACASLGLPEETASEAAAAIAALAAIYIGSTAFEDAVEKSSGKKKD